MTMPRLSTKEGKSLLNNPSVYPIYSLTYRDIEYSFLKSRKKNKTTHGDSKI